jgi:hypothetical protein
LNLLSLKGEWASGSFALFIGVLTERVRGTPFPLLYKEKKKEFSSFLKEVLTGKTGKNE